MTGKIKLVLPDKGFGYIRGDHDKVEYFFHRQDFNGHWKDLCDDTLSRERNSLPVSFDIAESQRGPRAANVSRMDGQ